jgi:hypothetical protein
MRSFHELAAAGIQNYKILILLTPMFQKIMAKAVPSF